jgi:hypothetical protein
MLKKLTFAFAMAAVVTACSNETPSDTAPVEQQPGTGAGGAPVENPTDVKEK